MEKKITSAKVTKSKYYEFSECHYLNLTLENVDGIDPRSIVSVILNDDTENYGRDERVRILEITNPDGKIIEDLKEINSNKDLRLFLYTELKDGDVLGD
jgi:hypothetical protein